jgi:hypothetical protein
MGLFDRFRGRWTLDGVARPWGERPSIYRHVVEHTDPATGRLRPEGVRLPDEKPDDGKSARWAAGALDGVTGHHMQSGDTALRVKQTVAALQKVLAHASAGDLRHLYALVTRERILAVLDQVTDQLRGLPGLQPERVHALGAVLAREAADRDAVKLGVALLGMIRGPEGDRDLLTGLGVHDEFTLFCVVALANQEDDPEPALWELAKRVDGWGRISVVERLAGAKRPEVRAWLLREGFRNSVMDEYLAHTCATAGELHVALRSATVDAELLHGAAGIFVALCNGGPAQDMSDYGHAEEAVAAWMGHVERAPVDPAILEALDALEERPELSAALKARIAACRSGPAVDACIAAGLASADRVELGRADQAARRRGIRTFERHEAVVRGGSATGDVSYAMYRMMEEADAASIDRALEAAATRIDEGPHLLDAVLQRIAQFPGKGAGFVVAGLRSPVVRNRNIALRAAAAWGKERWTEEMKQALEKGVEVEPDAKVKERFASVLKGERGA